MIVTHQGEYAPCECAIDSPPEPQRFGTRITAWNTDLDYRMKNIQWRAVAECDCITRPGEEAVIGPAAATNFPKRINAST